MRDVNSQIRVIHLFDFPLSSHWLHEGFFPVLKVFAFSTIKIPIITQNALELSCWLAVALNYLDQPGEVGGRGDDHRHSVGMQEDSLRRQHASREGVFPSEAQHIDGELGGKIYKPNFFRTTKLRAKWLLAGAKRSSPQRGEGKKIRISNSRCESFLPRRQRRETAAAGLKLPKWKVLFWEWLA